MKLHELRPNEGAHTRRRRLGRGHGSGRVKTSGRGTKGQNSRSGKGVKPWFEGGQNPWTAKIPHRRGFSNARFRVEAQVVNLRDLESAFQAQDVVDLNALLQRGMIDRITPRRPVKLLGDGTLTKPLTIEVHRASASARAAVESAGGTLTVLAPVVPKERRNSRTRGATAEPAPEARSEPRPEDAPE